MTINTERYPITLNNNIETLTLRMTITLTPTLDHKPYPTPYIDHNTEPVNPNTNLTLPINSNHKSCILTIHPNSTHEP